MRVIHPCGCWDHWRSDDGPPYIDDQLVCERHANQQLVALGWDRRMLTTRPFSNFQIVGLTMD